MKRYERLLSNKDELLQRMLAKGKKGLLRTVFGRTTIVALLLVLQVLLHFLFYRYLEQIYPLYFGSLTLLTVVMILRIINDTGDPTVKLTWSAVIAAAPVSGTIFYWYVRIDPGYLQQERRLRQVEKDAHPLVPDQKPLMERLKREDPPLWQLAHYTARYASAPVYANTEVTYYPLGEEMFSALLEEIRKAEKFVFLEYFAIAKGELWSELLTLLTRKAKEGVEVRLIYDGTCDFVSLPHLYPKALEALGIHCRVFSPIRPVITTSYNNRDHRKICLIDGHTAFTGGVNLEDAYINREVRYGHWKDAAIKLRGDGARSFAHLFLQMWTASGSTEEDWSPYLIRPGESGITAPGYVIPYGDSPLDAELVGESVYLDIINRANETLFIMTPYLILDNTMVSALSFAAKRGVEVKMILPHIPDKEYAFALAKTHYKELTQAGVQLFEYTPGFVHSKVFLADDSRGVVGTINLDYRSLYLHFECAAYLQDVPALADIRADFEATLAKCQPVTEESIQKEKLSRRLLGKLLKVLAPLM